MDIKEYADNRIKADITADEFHIQVEGFDPNRDLIVNAKVKTAEAVEEEHDAAAV